MRPIIFYRSLRKGDYAASFSHLICAGVWMRIGARDWASHETITCTPLRRRDIAGGGMAGRWCSIKRGLRSNQCKHNLCLKMRSCQGHLIKPIIAFSFFLFFFSVEKKPDRERAAWDPTPWEVLCLCPSPSCLSYCPGVSPIALWDLKVYFRQILKKTTQINEAFL